MNGRQGGACFELRGVSCWRLVLNDRQEGCLVLGCFGVSCVGTEHYDRQGRSEIWVDIEGVNCWG